MNDVLVERMKTDIRATVAYHELEKRDPDAPAHFKFKITHRVSFQVTQIESGNIKAATFATLTKLEAWGTAATSMIWQVRWTPKGLTPIKPAIYTTTDINLLPGKCLKLNAEG